MLEELAPWLALCLALSLVPVYAFSTADVARDSQAAVVDDGEAYLGVSTLTPVLNASNGYEDDALTVTHRYAEGTTLKVWVNNTATDPRYAFVNDTFSLSAGGSHTVQVEDTSTDHAADTSTVEARVDAMVREDLENHGKQSMTRNVTVTVE